MTLATRNQ